MKGVRPRVLVVDDDANLLAAIADELSAFADVVTRTSVAAALPLITRDSFDAVITDLRMPERWGDELLAHVSARSPQTRRFMLTGDSDPRRTLRELLEDGVVEKVFVKPRADGLIEAVRRLTFLGEPQPQPQEEESPGPTSG